MLSSFDIIEQSRWNVLGRLGLDLSQPTFYKKGIFGPDCSSFVGTNQRIHFWIYGTRWKEIDFPAKKIYFFRSGMIKKLFEAILKIRGEIPSAKEQWLNWERRLWLLRHPFEEAEFFNILAKTFLLKMLFWKFEIFK